MEPRFTVGQEVRLRAEPERSGVVRSANSYGSGWAYRIFFAADSILLYNESALEPVPSTPPLAQVVPRERFLRGLLLTKLRTPLNDVLYAYQASRTQFEAYQFKPVLKFLDSPVPGLLIADEVGLGKTIEAAILLQELRARGPMRRVLVICPAGLREKWKAELLTRFDENFQIMFKRDAEEDARQFVTTNGANPLNGIISLESFRSDELQSTLESSGVTYDLVVIDEAHHLRTTGTLSNAVGERMSEMADQLLLLTATPLQTSQTDLFNLLRFLDPSQYAHLDDFLLQLQPNGLLNDAIGALRRQVPDFARARERLARIPDLDAGTQVTLHPTYPLVVDALDREPTDRESLVRLQRDIDSLNVISAIYNRTIKRDVSSAAERAAHAIDVEVTAAEQQFLEAVLGHARAQARSRSKGRLTPGFAGIQRERQAASCIAATREYLQQSVASRALGRGGVDLEVEGSDPDFSGEDVDDPADFDVGRSEQELLAAATALGDTDSKFERFIETLNAVLAENDHSKVIVFTFFRRTIAYLEGQLSRRRIEYVVIKGGVKPEERAQRIARFQDSKSIRVLLTTEVGSEGLDFQFCDVMFNYDLPWNPMRVEQRIGRIDRYGQQSPRIRIYSFFLRGTIEERILERLYDRIGIFEESIGELEPILGPIVAELTRDVFRSELSPEEEARVAERYERMILQRREEERQLEDSANKLLGQDVLLLQEIGDSVSSGRYVSPAELRAVVSGFMQEVLGSDLIDQSRDGHTVLIPTGSKLASLVTDHVQRERDARPLVGTFIAKINGNSRIAATFEGQLALRRPLLEFLNIRHPLVQMAVKHFQADGASRSGPVPFACLFVDTARLEARDGPWPPPGKYEFMLALLTVTGARQQVKLLPIAFESKTHRRVPVLEDRLLRLIQEFAKDDVSTSAIPWESRDALETRALSVAAAAANQLEADAIERNEATIAVRKATLQRSFGHRIARRRTTLTRVSDERIVRMQRSALANLEADLARRIGDLEARREVAVSFQPVGMGLIEVGESPPLSVPVANDEDVDEPPPAGVPPFEEPPQVFRG